jgi:serine phosphatase RsbU (regulator of sigma subunit)
MTMLGSGLLNEIVNELEIFEPSAILNKLRDKIISSLRQTGRSGENKDGMDIVLLRFDSDRKELCYAAANNGFLLVKDDTWKEYVGNKQPVGIYGETLEPFESHSLRLEPNDAIYAYTDGFPDQFGGPKGKKFKYKQLNELLARNHDLPMNEQKEKLKSEFESWQGELEQIDDVCVIGIKLV